MKLSTDKDVKVGVGTRVREIRKWLRLSQGAVADFLEIPRSGISAVEAGTRGVDVSELIGLCRLFRCEPNVLLGLDRPPIGTIASPNGAVSFNPRIQSSSEGIDPQDLKEIENFAAALRENKKRVSTLHALLRSENPKEPKAAAELVRKTLGLDKVPVDIYEAIGRLGISLRFSTLGELSGALIREKRGNEDVYGVVVNSDQPDDRIRFSAAHETGHAFMMHQAEDSRMYSPKGRRFDGVEKDADTFAAEVLMPAPEVVNRAEKIKKKTGAVAAEDIYELSDEFLVSYQAMLVRVYSLGIISSVDYKNFSVQKPSELELRLKEKRAQVKPVEFDTKDLKKLIDKMGRPDGDSRNQDPDWIRALQESAVEHYLASTDIWNRATDVKRVYEQVVLWVAEHYPLDFEASFKVPS